MKLRSIRVEQLRQFRQAVCIEDLADGINLFTGPNESGKSTLVRAIRAAFFERHKSASVEDLQPWGDSSAAPRVTLEFDWGGERWRLVKSFLRQKRCDLQVGGRAFSGEEAEERLAGLLGFQFPGRGASRPEHWGIPGLLWIEQGTGHELQQAVAFAGEHLKSALGRSLGEVASSAGDEVLARVERERALLLTSTGRPTGEYQRAIAEHEEQGAALGQLDADLATYREQVDRLGELFELMREDHGRPWEEFRRQAAEAAARLAEARGAQAEQQRAREQLEEGRAAQRACRERLLDFDGQEQELRDRGEKQRVAERALADLRAAQPAIASRLERAQAAHGVARDALQVAHQEEQRTQLQGSVVQLTNELDAAAGRLGKAQTLQAELLDLREELQSTEIDTRRLARLKKDARALEDLALQERTVATRLRFELQPQRHLLLGDETLTGHGERLLLEPVRLRVEGVGDLHIQPGGEELAELLRQRERLQDAVAAALAALRVASLAQAEERVERARTLRHEIERRESLLGAIAPEGIDALHQALQLESRRREGLQASLAELPAATAAAASVKDAQRAAERASEELDAARRAAVDLEREIGIAEHDFAHARAECQRVEALVQAPDRRRQVDESQAKLVELLATERALQETIATRQLAIDAARPEVLEQDQRRLDASADSLEHEAQVRERDFHRLQSSLEALGAHGIEERRAATLQTLELAARRREQLGRRAGALDLLLGLLRAKRQELTRRLQAPLQRHLNHYLQLLFAQASLDVDENLVPQTLVRRVDGSDQHGDVPALSFGAREQTGLISRLAYADLLQEAGRPTLIILDDALVHTDRERLAQMKRILFDAAGRHQILLFSCHPEDWRDLGVAAREMRSL